MPDFVMNSMLCTVRRQVAFLASHLSPDIVLLVACLECYGFCQPKGRGTLIAAAKCAIGSLVKEGMRFKSAKYLRGPA